MDKVLSSLICVAAEKELKTFPSRIISLSANPEMQWLETASPDRFSAYFEKRSGNVGKGKFERL